MKKILSFALMMLFVAGMAFSQEVKKVEKKEAKTEVKADTTKKAAVAHKKAEHKKADKKKTEPKK
jgi:hypothetical protein